jgi:hypothetical protein
MVLGLIGNIAGNLDQEAFVQGAENESRLQALQRQNQNRINRDFFRDQQGGPPAIPMPIALNQGSAGLSLDGFSGQYIDVPPPVKEKEPEVVVPENKAIIPPGQDGSGDPFFNSEEGDGTGEDQITSDTGDTASNQLSVPDFDPNKELDFSGIGTGNTPDITQLDPKSSKFMKDIDTLFARGDFAKIMSKIKVRAATGYGDALAGSPWGNFLGYFTDSPEQAKERSISTEASNWFQSKEALNYFLQNKDQLKTAAIDPTGWYKKFKEDAPKRQELQINRESPAKADKRVTDLTTDDVLTKALGNKKVVEVRNVAAAIGLNPDFAMAIMGMESSFGTAKNLTSTKGAKGIMQVMPETFDQMKAWYTNPENIKKYNIPQEVVNLAAAMQKGNMQGPEAGLLYLKYGQYIGVPMNLLAAGYQGGMESVLQRGTPTTANDGSLTNTDYNRAVIGIYNKILEKTGGTTITSTNNKPFKENQTTSGTTGSTTTATTNNQIAGLVTDVETNTSGQSTNTGNQGTASGDVSSLKNVEQGAGVDDGTKVAPENNIPETKAEPKPPAFYQKDPSQTGFELRNFLEERELIINQTNQTVNILAQRSDYFRRLAEVSRVGGTDEESYNNLINQSTELMAKATDARNKGALEAKKAENKIMYLQGMQALSDLTKGSVDRAAMVWSQYSGLDIRINPRSDGKYDVTIGGKPYKTMDQKQLSNTLQLAFDQGYRGSQATLRGELAMLDYKSTLAIVEQQYKDNAANYRERLKAQFDLLKEKYKADNTVKIQQTGDGGIVITKGKDTFILQEQKFTDINGKDSYRFIEQKVTSVDGTGTNSYKR